MSRRENSQGNQQMTYDIYVGNVPKSISENDVKQAFVKYGEIKQVLCRWKEDFTGVGYAIVKYVFKADADKLLQETTEVVWNGHSFPVKAARRSDHNQYNGHMMQENKPNYFPDFVPKPFLMNTPILKPDFSQFYHGNYHEDQSVHSVPLMLEVLCTNVEDAITFYGCPVHRFDELSNVSHAINCLNYPPNRDKKFIPKKIYAALYSEDRTWYRCTVVRASIPNKPGMCTVRYIDYGNQEDTSYKNVVELPDALQNVPPFATKFVFSNLMCESKSNKQTYLHQLTNKRMSLCAVLSPVGSEYQVLKCSCNGKDVISETVKKGFAAFKKVQKTIPPPKPAPSNKMNSKSNTVVPENKKNKTIVCNGVNGHSSDPQENGGVASENSQNVKKARKSTDNVPKLEDVNSNETGDNSDFRPRIIIKRGSDLNDIVGSKEAVESKKEKEVKQQLPPPLIDSVITNLKLINNIRALVSQSTDDSIIQRAVDILQSELTTLILPENVISGVNDAFENFIHSLNEIKKCTDKALLPNLKLERDTKQKLLCDKLKEFLEKFYTSIFARKKKILQTITDLVSNSNDWMNVELKSVPKNIDELVMEYSSVKEQRWSSVRKARENTDEKHKHFMEVLTDLQKKFYLNTEEGESNKCDPLSVEGESKRTSHSAKFDEALKELGKAADKEILTLTLNKGKDSVTIIQCLLTELDAHKEKIESVCELYENKLKLYNDLSKNIDSNSILTQLAAVQEEVCHSLLRLTHYKDSHEKNLKKSFYPTVCKLSKHDDVTLHEESANPQPELVAVIRILHSALLKEDSLMETLSKASQEFRPELSIEHPELKLQEYFQSKFLLKYNWKPDYFLNFENKSKAKSSYISKLLDDPIVIKEYKHETKEDMTKFLQIAFIWNDCKSEFLLKIKALFFKTENTMCVICPLVPYSLVECPPIPVPLDGEKACDTLRQVLLCLKELHSHKIVYSAIHPSTVLIENGKILLDFCFNPKDLEGNTVLKGINFRPPENEISEKSADMYGFGCLVLWLLFPNLSFTSTEDGVPNIAAFRSIIEDALTAKDYALLCSLVNSKPKSRPTACHLLSKGFLSSYESYCRFRNKAVSGS